MSAVCDKLRNAHRLRRLYSAAVSMIKAVPNLTTVLCASVLAAGRFPVEATGTVGVTRSGLVDLDRLRAALRDGPPALLLHQSSAMACVPQRQMPRVPW